MCIFSVLGVSQHTNIDIASGGTKKISEQYFASELGTVFTNSKDWEGGRVSRQKRDDSRKRV